METLPGWNINWSPISFNRSCAAGSSTPHSAHSLHSSSVPVRMREEDILIRYANTTGSDDECSEASISLNELMSNPVQSQQGQHQNGDEGNESSTACLASPDCSRDTLDTSDAIVVVPYEQTAKTRNQHRSFRYQTEKSRRNAGCSPTLEDYLTKTRPEDVSNLDESNATLFGGIMSRSRSHDSLPTMEKESVTGRKFVRRRSNSFSNRESQKHPNEKMIIDIDRLKLEGDDESTVAPLPTKLPVKLYCDSIEDGCRDEDSYMRRARGRRLSKQNIVRDTSTGRNKRNADMRWSLLRKERSAHQLKRADDFLRATDAESLKDLVDSWKEESNKEISGTLQRHLTKVSSETLSKSDPPRYRARTILRGVIESQEPSFSSVCSGLVSTEVSETSIRSNNTLSVRRTPSLNEFADAHLSPSKHVHDGEKGQTSVNTSIGCEEAYETMQDSSVILQFDATQEDHVHRVYLDHADGYLLRIDCDEGLMEGIVCKMPISEESASESTSTHDQHSNDINQLHRVSQGQKNERPVNSRPQMLWRGPSSFFARRPKAQTISGDNTKTDEKALLFDDLGRLIEE